MALMGCKQVHTKLALNSYLQVITVVSNMTAKLSAKSYIPLWSLCCKNEVQLCKFTVPRGISRGTGQERGGKKETGERKRPGQGSWERKRKRKEKTR